MIVGLFMAAIAFNTPKGVATQFRGRFQVATFATSDDSPEEILLDQAHDFQLKRSYYYVVGMKGTRPHEQHQYKQGTPKLVCTKCNKRIGAVLHPGKPSEDVTSFQLPEWNDEQFMVPENPVDLRGSCGEIVKFRAGYETYTVERILLEEKVPESILTRLVSKQWETDPFSTISLDDGNKKYFPFVLEFIRDGSVQLPSFKDLTHFGIEFDPDKITAGFDPAIMARAILASQERLEGFQERIIKNELQKQLDDAQMQLDAAIVAHLIIEKYSKEGRLRFDVVLPDKVAFDLRNEQHLTCCNAFLKDFGVCIEKVKSYYSNTVELNFIE